MTKKLLFSLLISTLILSCKDNNIQINGKLNNLDEPISIYLDEIASTDIQHYDSTDVSADGEFSFKFHIDRPSFYLLTIHRNNYLMLLVEPGQKIEITTNADSLSAPARISGSPGTSEMINLNKRINETIQKLSQLSSIYDEHLGKKDLYKVMERLDSTANVYLTEINSFTKDYINRNMGSLVCLPALYQQIAPGESVLHPERDIDYFIKVDSALYHNYPDYDPVYHLHEQVQNLKNQIKAQQKQTPDYLLGKQAPDFSLPDTTGNIISLSSTKGETVLLDFWASWCPPCRKENPFLRKAFNTFKDKGFTIVQVSLDKTDEAWKKGIADDHLEQWIHVSDLKYWNSNVVELYNITSIPYNLLLDTNGKIIAVNLRGEELMKKLSEIFNKQ